MAEAEYLFFDGLNADGNLCALVDLTPELMEAIGQRSDFKFFLNRIEAALSEFGFDQVEMSRGVVSIVGEEEEGEDDVETPQ